MSAEKLRKLKAFILLSANKKEASLIMFNDIQLKLFTRPLKMLQDF